MIRSTLRRLSNSISRKEDSNASMQNRSADISAAIAQEASLQAELEKLLATIRDLEVQVREGKDTISKLKLVYLAFLLSLCSPACNLFSFLRHRLSLCLT